MKHKFYYSENKVIAVSAYKNGYVRGIAKCHPEDPFDKEFGERLAGARCDALHARKKYLHARNKAKLAYEALQRATKAYEEAKKFEKDTGLKLREALDNEILINNKI